MDEKDIEGGLDGLTDFIALLWNNIVIPVFNGIGALFEMLPPVATGIIVGVLLIVWLFRRARHG